MSLLLRLAERLAHYQLQIAGLAVAAILLTITVDVGMRALFNAPFSVTTELVSYYYMVPLTFLPIMMLEMRGEHIDTTLFYQMFPKSLKKLARVVSGVITIGIYGLLTRFTFAQALTSTASGEVAMGVNLLPIWPVRWVLPVVFALSTVAAFLMTVHYLSGNANDE
ncbi:TRAP transporter small permease [Hoeflea prorocentri]|uniref:TRAP transporter small permease protein n=1 Tax=Hoeflea prorocentri TaxID=1922333 RepID=A0A9X3ZIX5_9HYPH|nr:TRAP transporter small permease [Hoeflea prorocentri]MCY6382200.1 TRAP transporter small permease [Hoeflea prorocentri]MDA5400000.1 TRAP transporter small permease [Hoeflea prorocentri]